MSAETSPLFDLSRTQIRPLQVGILVAPGFAPCDIIGFQTIFGFTPGVTIHLLWKDREEVIGIPTFPTRATTTFDECPADLDVLYAGAVPPEIFEDAETLDFLADRGSRAGWIAGSCVGSLLLGAAGLLVGYRATTNFHVHHLLPYFGAIPATGNVIEDRNRITAGPVTGSNEIGLRLIQHFYGDDLARQQELAMEYAPTPLFNVGTPELAGPELTARAFAASAAMSESFEALGRRAAERLNVTV
ncbi:DJ-1/PfpI family protein [Streptomyces sp. NEAU-W12]|uniref:DJ-1/PfpI family protein n=1 Tax=Streptomyces sp. NEAU-W12 TaxID=2994668 RepID=UPI00224B1B7C|nr:DJ-1/PfpI family protein [Streptomyces sp. NEAU-W12]MCX2925577.1 DJ-1/PfpI family protein [Streptomyces sp. NEAU-W12]